MTSRPVVRVNPGDMRGISSYGAPVSRAQHQARVSSKFAQPKSTRSKTFRVDHKRANRLDRNCSAVNFLWQAEWGDAPSVGTYNVKMGRFGRDMSIGKRPRDTRPLGPAQALATLGGAGSC